MDRSVETAEPEVARVADANAVSRPPSSPPPPRGEGAAGSVAPGRLPGGTRPRVPDLSQSVLEAQRDDPEAFRELYRDIQPRLLRYLSALVGHDGCLPTPGIRPDLCRKGCYHDPESTRPLSVSDAAGQRPRLGE